MVLYIHNTLVTKFKIANETFSRCALQPESNKVKFPDKGKEMEIKWLNRSYVNLTVSGDILYFNVSDFISVQVFLLYISC